MSETRIVHLDALRDLYDATDPIPLSRDVYWTVEPDGVVWLAHVCTYKNTVSPRWFWAGTGRHQLISLDPLHLEPSIGWTDCCGRHGFIRNGKWEPAGDGGWQPDEGRNS